MAQGTVKSLVSSLNSNLTNRQAVVANADCQCTYNGVKFTRTGNVVMVEIRGFVSLPNGNTVICNIPTDFRITASDKSQYAFDAIVGSGNDGTALRVIRLTLNLNGSLNVYNYGSAMTNNNANPIGIFIVN